MQIGENICKENFMLCDALAASWVVTLDCYIFL